LQAFGKDRLLAWSDATVGDFRQWHYGGPQPSAPLASAFPEHSPTTAGAWCETTAPDLGSSYSFWFAVVVGSAPVQLLNGAFGPGVPETGQVSGPPTVP